MDIPRFLEDKQVEFARQVHPDAYDAQHLAHELHEPGRNVVKTVLLRANHGFCYVVAVLPATYQVDLGRLADALGHAEVQLATATEIAKCCPDCESGVLPPFGSQYNMQTIVDETLAEDEEIVMQGNTRHEAIRMKYGDFYALEHPLVASFVRRADKAEGPFR